GSNGWRGRIRPSTVGPQSRSPYTSRREDLCGGIFFIASAAPPESTSHYGNAAAREGTVDGSRVHSRRTLDAAECIDGPRSAAVTSGALREIPAASGHGTSACSADLGARYRITTDYRAFRKELNQ